MDRNQEVQVAKLLEEVLANTYVLYIKTQNLHWNMVDPRFYSLHLLLEKHYEELADQVDEIAERIRMVNCKSPGSMKRFLELASIKEVNNDDMDSISFLLALAQDHEHMANTLRERIRESQSLGDEGTADLFIKLLRDHEKMNWMLKAHFQSFSLEPV